MANNLESIWNSQNNKTPSHDTKFSHVYKYILIPIQFNYFLCQKNTQVCDFKLMKYLI